MGRLGTTVIFVTDFADQSVLMPLYFLIAVGLALLGWKRGALAWIVTAGMTLGFLVVLKIVLLACGWRWTGGVVQSPSGHTASSTLVYGSLGALAFRHRWPEMRALAFVPPLAVAALIGASRLVLGVHTPAEVVIGAIIGLAGVAFLLWLAGDPPARLRFRRLLLAGVVIAVVLHGERLRAERVLRHLTIAGIWPPAACVEPHAAHRPVPLRAS